MNEDSLNTPSEHVEDNLAEPAAGDAARAAPASDILPLPQPHTGVEGPSSPVTFRGQLRDDSTHSAQTEHDLTSGKVPGKQDGTPSPTAGQPVDSLSVEQLGNSVNVDGMNLRGKFQLSGSERNMTKNEGTPAVIPPAFQPLEPVPLQRGLPYHYQSSQYRPGAFRVLPGMLPMRMAHDSASEAVNSVSNESPRVPAATTRSNRLVLDAVLVESDANDPEDLPKIQVATEADPVELASKSLRRRVILVVLVATVVLVASTVAAAVSLNRKSVSAIYRNITIQEFRDAVLPPVSLQKATLDPQSPQGRALQWLTDDVQGKRLLGRQMLQRFSLAAIYYSLGGEYWYNQSSWLSPQDECSWLRACPAPCDSNGNIVCLSLWENNLTGSLPFELSQLLKLEIILLSGNSISANIPAEVGSLSNVHILDLPANRINGTIPSELGNMAQLNLLSFHDNSVSGTLPTEIGKLSELRQFTLYQNVLTGTLPSELGLMRNLEGLVASDNKLNGSIPIEMGVMSALRSLNLLNNELTGVMPPQVCFVFCLISFGISYFQSYAYRVCSFAPCRQRESSPCAFQRTSCNRTALPSARGLWALSIPAAVSYCCLENIKSSTHKESIG
jgi:hypothetical protein